MRTAIVENGIIINVIVGKIEGSVEIQDGFGIGDLYDDGEFKKAPITPIEPEPIKVPTQITPRQLRLQLLKLELLDDVEAMCKADKAMGIWFEYSLDFQRDHEMVTAMGTQLGMSEDDMDSFFIEASKL